MSSLGPISFGEKEELVFLGKGISEQRNYSEKVAAQIDKEVAKFIKNAEKEATKILTKRRKLLDKIANTLIEKETIEKEEFENLILNRSAITRRREAPTGLDKGAPEKKTSSKRKRGRSASVKVKIKKVK